MCVWSEESSYQSDNGSHVCLTNHFPFWCSAVVRLKVCILYLCICVVSLSYNAVEVGVPQQHGAVVARWRVQV